MEYCEKATKIVIPGGSDSTVRVITGQAELINCIRELKYDYPDLVEETVCYKNADGSETVRFVFPIKFLADFDEWFVIPG